MIRISLLALVLVFLLGGCGYEEGKLTNVKSIFLVDIPKLSANRTVVHATKGVAINAIIIHSTAGDVERYSISPQIDNGLSFNTSTGTISGTPLNNALEITYTITAINNKGSDTLLISIIVDGTSVRVSGKVTYDLIRPSSNGRGLNYRNIIREPVKNVWIEAIDQSDNIVDATMTDMQGTYNFNILVNGIVKIRVLSKMIKTDGPTWSVKIINNVQDNAIYAMEGTYINVGNQDKIVDLHASSGWGGVSYAAKRVAAPFALLDTIYKSMTKVLEADAAMHFPALLVHWSTQNVTTQGSIQNGEIGTSFYKDSKLYILGDANGDTDEYDSHVVAHEWGHYYEDKFSRSDSIGGNHTSGEKLDIRVAFSEGFGNAFSAMALNNTLYVDTQGLKQSRGFQFDMESAIKDTPGWYSEASIQRILYDIYDSHNDGRDTLSLGFSALHNVFIEEQKKSLAFTSIFPFITALKKQNISNSPKISAIVASENIASIDDIYGLGRSNIPTQIQLYKHLSVGETVEICPSYDEIHSSDGNKLGNHKFVHFELTEYKKYTLTVKKKSGSEKTNPNFRLYRMDNYALAVVGSSSGRDKEEQKAYLSDGHYIFDIYDKNQIDNICFEVTVE